MKTHDPRHIDDNVSTSMQNRNHAAIALKWTRWPAALGLIVGTSAAMKGSPTVLGKVFLGAILGDALATILGGITFVIVLLIIKLSGK